MDLIRTAAHSDNLVNFDLCCDPTELCPAPAHVNGGNAFGKDPALLIGAKNAHGNLHHFSRFATLAHVRALSLVRIVCREYSWFGIYCALLQKTSGSGPWERPKMGKRVAKPCRRPVVLRW